jgi:hypothetical protein
MVQVLTEQTVWWACLQSPACKLTKHRKKSKMHLEMARINMSILLEIIEVARLNTK